MKAAMEQARVCREQRQLPLTPPRQAFIARYEALLAAGLAANPPPERSVRVADGSSNRLRAICFERLWLDSCCALL